MEITCGNYEPTNLQDHVVYNELELKKWFMGNLDEFSLEQQPHPCVLWGTKHGSLNNSIGVTI
jgi:hypothetical protein